MFIIIRIIAQYGLLLIAIIFLVWISTVEILYQDKICYSIQIENFPYKNVNISSDYSIIDPRLKLNHFTIVGTHNSYHKANLFYKYEHQPLDIQLSYGIRQIELDIHLKTNNKLIYHLQLFDDKTNCYCFKQCLDKIGQWTQTNPFHYPIYLFIEIKAQFYEDLTIVLAGGVQCKHFQQIKEQILQIFSLNTFILPKDVQGNQTSIKLALKQQRQNELEGDYTYYNYGWPPLYQSLGKIIPVFLDDVHNRALTFYSTCYPLREFFFIAQSNVNLSYSSIITVSNLIQNQQMLTDNINNGFITRILLGYGGDNLDQIYQSFKPYGIHIISSDSEHCNDTSLCQHLANDFQNSVVLCNNYYAPPFCNSSISFL